MVSPETVTKGAVSLRPQLDWIDLGLSAQTPKAKSRYPTLLQYIKVLVAVSCPAVTRLPAGALSAPGVVTVAKSPTRWTLGVWTDGQ